MARDATIHTVFEGTSEIRRRVIAHHLRRPRALTGSTTGRPGCRIENAPN